MWYGRGKNSPCIFLNGKYSITSIIYVSQNSGKRKVWERQNQFAWAKHKECYHLVAEWRYKEHCQKFRLNLPCSWSLWKWLIKRKCCCCNRKIRINPVFLQQQLWDNDLMFSKASFWNRNKDFKWLLGNEMTTIEYCMSIFWIGESSRQCKWPMKNSNSSTFW